MSINTLQWILVIGVSVILYFIAPLARTEKAFFKGEGSSGKPNFGLLTSSLVISWLFAKSITNSANLGLDYGIVGGVAYAGYYLSFIVAGLIIYRLRTVGGFKSIHHFLETKFGKSALIIFSMLISFRMFNEVWSNSMVIGSYFGDQGTTPYLWAVVVFTTLTIAYTIKGGMGSSLFTDMIQMILFSILLGVILFKIFPRADWDIGAFVTSGTWSMSQGVNLLLLAILQSLSYPFHDPVMTDRGFVTDAKTTRKSYLWASVIGMTCIILFSFVGIYGRMEGISGQAPVEVAKLLGIPMMLVMNFIMITSAASTLDSTFSSFSKMVHLDLKIAKPTLTGGRISMIVIAVAGTIPVFFNPDIISATTYSGTVVIGLAPIFVLWKMKVPPISFHLSVVGGFIAVVAMIVYPLPESFYFSTGKYADLLAINVFGSIICFLLYLIPKMFSSLKTNTVIAEETSQASEHLL